jgi:WD40 repeat protein
LVAAGLLVLVLAFAGFAAWALHERRIAADRADVNESQADAARSLRVQSLDPKGSLALAAQAAAKSPTPQADEALRRALVALPKPTPLFRRGLTVYGVDFSPNGRLVAAAGRGGVRVSTDTGRELTTLLPRTLVYSARFSRDGRFLVTAGADGAVRVWRVGEWREAASEVRILPNLVARASFTDDGRFLVAGGYPGWPNRVWRFEEGRVGQQLTKRDGLGGWIEPDATARVVNAETAASAARLASAYPYSFTTSRDGTLAVVEGDELTRVVRTRTRKLVTTLPDAYGAVLSPGGSRVATQTGIIWDLEFREPVAMLSGFNEGMSFSRDGRLVVSASGEPDAARVWDVESGVVLAELPPRPPRYQDPVSLADPYPLPPPPGQVGLPPPVTGVGEGGIPPAFDLKPAAEFSPDANLVVTWGRDGGGAQLWHPFGTHPLGRLRTRLEGADVALPLPTALSHDGRLVATALRTGEIELRSTSDGRRLASLRGSTGFVSSLAFSRAGDLLAAGSFDRTVRIWRAADGRLEQTLRGHRKRVGRVAFSPDGTLLASASEDHTARIWRLPGGELVRVLREPAGPVTSVSFSDDGEALVTAGDKGIARVWSTGSWRQRAVLGPTRSKARVLEASFSRDGRYVATLEASFRRERGFVVPEGEDATARIWRSDGGRPIQTMKNAATVAFSPNGEQLLVAGGDATVRIFRPSDGAQTGLLRGHTSIVNSARFSAAGDLIVSASADGSTRVWQPATGGTVAVLTPSRAALVDAMLAADGRLVTVGEDGVRLYSCEPCLEPAPLRALAEERLASARSRGRG